MSRYSEVDPANLTPEQKAVAEAIATGPRGSIRGPFTPWLLSPELADRAQKLGAFARYHTTLPERLKELAILYTARHWRAEFEWHVHAPLAIEAGLARAAVEAIARGETPDFEAEDEAAVWAFSDELYRTGRVSDAAHAAVEALAGQRGVAELTGVLGYYALVAMTLNVFEVPSPDDRTAPEMTGD